MLSWIFTQVRLIIGIAVFAAVYCAVGELSLQYDRLAQGVAPLWPIAGISFAVLLLWGYRFWPGIFIGELLNFFTDTPLDSAQILAATFNTLAILIGVGILRTVLKIPDRDMFRRGFYIVLFITGALMASLFSASFGSGVLLFTQKIEQTEVLGHWLHWFIANLVGILVIAPLIVSWFLRNIARWHTPKLFEALLLFISMSFAVWGVFGQFMGEILHAYPITFLLMPFPIWSAFRFGQRETMFVIFLLSVVALIATLYDLGPFARGNLYESMFLLQAFLAVLTITTLFLIALVRERTALEVSLRQSQDALQEINEHLEQKVVERTEKLRSANKKMRQATEKYRSIFVHAIEGIYQIKPDGRFINANPALAKMYGYDSSEQMMSELKTMEKLYIDAKRRKEFHAYMKKRGSVNEFESEVLLRNGASMWISENSRIVLNEKGQVSYYEGTMINITDRRHEANRLKQMAHYDALTGLGNRRLFQIRLQQAVMQARSSGNPGVLMYFDLDGFKQVNDKLGHAFGDAVLKEVATRLNACTRDADAVCRLGGDEFSLIANNITRQEHALVIAKKVLAQFANPIVWQKKRARVGISIGITFFDGKQDNLKVLIKQADAAMYAAKQSGKGTYQVYQPQRTAPKRQRAA